jgi:hypothetical protein
MRTLDLKIVVGSFLHKRLFPRREDCDRIATMLRTNADLGLSTGNGVTKTGRTRTSATAESYHAGLTAHRRKTIQNQVDVHGLRSSWMSCCTPG